MVYRLRVAILILLMDSRGVVGRHGEFDGRDSLRLLPLRRLL